MTCTDWLISLKPEEIYSSMGAPAGEIALVLPQIEKIRPVAEKLIAARSISTIVSVQSSAKKQIRLGGLPFTCNTRYFRGATHAAVLIATVGSGLERESERCLSRGNYREGLIYDACGSAALDAVLGLVREQISITAAKLGRKLGYTLSPGCQMIPLAEQATIFSLLDFTTVGVGLTDSLMMMPAKSLSAVIPIGESLDLPNNANYACEICSQQQHCQYRTAR